MTSRPAHLQQGTDAEQQACDWLQRQGLRLIERNFRCRLGEIDLIMNDGGAIAFIEVRFRRNQRFGSGAETVDYRKQQKLVATAQHYLQRRPRLADRPCRFDVISMHNTPQGVRIDWIRDAFQTA